MCRGISVTGIPETSPPRETGQQIAALEHLLEVARIAMPDQPAPIRLA